jgi:hypothetical protein
LEFKSSKTWKLLLSIAAHVTTILFSQSALGGTSGTIKKNPDS